MIVLGNILQGLAAVLDIVLSTIFWLVIIRAVLSWVNPDPFNPIVRFINSSTDPFLRVFRRWIPLIGGSIDITPIVLILLIQFLRIALVNTLFEYGNEIKKTSAVSVEQVVFPS